MTLFDQAQNLIHLLLSGQASLLQLLGERLSTEWIVWTFVVCAAAAMLRGILPVLDLTDAFGEAGWGGVLQLLNQRRVGLAFFCMVGLPSLLAIGAMAA